MKLKSNIVGLPVLSIVEVASLGKVEELVINPNTGSVDYLIIEPEQWYLERRVISIQDVLGIGEDALTTETKAKVVNITAVPNALELISKGVAVIGSKVITKKGRINGLIDELSIDEETGKIHACRWVATDNSRTGYIPTNLVVTFGQGMLVVEENFDVALAEDPSQLIVAAIENTESEKTPPSVLEDPLKIFEDKQKQYLIGRTVTLDIIADDGQTIAKEGDKITQQMVDRAVTADKFVELTLNNRD
ncbi:PRC-barrel domain-containing protein [Desulfotomaculum sp. 1211_IL3151]|uniref:PRC-barrel domain-containing protein n=1 Tax=Desulfotomaculum sp. 1211_IL3151 TaxID=3084055 RepID=UPI002FDACF7A